MEAEEFANKMSTIAFNIKESDKKEYDSEFISDLMSSYTFNKKASIDAGAGGPDPVLSLINSYDASKVEIGMITFNQSVLNDKMYYHFGKYEVDDLVLDKQSGQVLLKENRSDRVMFNCAENGSKFLDALLIAADFIASIPLGTDVSEDARVCAIAYQCASQAGGKKYTDFYKMLLGCYE